MEMSAEDFEELMRGLGFNRSSFARHVGMHRNTVNRWCTGDVGVPGIAACYVRLLAAGYGGVNPLKNWVQPKSFGEWPDHSKVTLRLTAGDVRKIQGSRRERKETA